MTSQSFVVNIADNDALLLEPLLAALQAAQAIANRALSTRYETTKVAEVLLDLISTDIDKSVSVITDHLFNGRV